MGGNIQHSTLNIEACEFEQEPAKFTKGEGNNGKQFFVSFAIFCSTSDAAIQCPDFSPQISDLIRVHLCLSVYELREPKPASCDLRFLGELLFKIRWFAGWNESFSTTGKRGKVGA